MNKEEKIRNLKELLRETIGHLDCSMQRDGTPDEVWMRDIESLTAAIQALIAQDTAELEQPATREGKLLSDVLWLVVDCVCDRRRGNTTADGVVARMLPDLILTALYGKHIGTILETAALKEAKFCARQVAEWDGYDGACTLLGRLALLLIERIPGQAMEVQCQ